MSRFAFVILGIVLLAGAGILAAGLIVYTRSQSAIADAAAHTTTGALVAPLLPTPQTQAAPINASNGPSVRVAVIGGMTFTGFWKDLSDRYEKQHGVKVEVIATGEKNDIATAFKKGGMDVITMHASDTVINLVADGYALDPQPWMRNDLIIVGPPADPAGIKGMTDAAAAIKKIAAAKTPFVVHSSLGAQEVLLNIMEPNQILFDPAQTTVLFDDQQRSVLQVAGKKQAYTLVGRIPFRIGRLPNDGLELMVEGDPRLMRPFIVAVANPAVIPGVRLDEARRFAKFLRETQTQNWIAGYGKGLIDDRPLFFPVFLDAPGARN